MKWANQSEPLGDEERRKLCRSFLTKGLEKSKPAFREFIAYGQACREMAIGIMQLLLQNDAVLFASLIPRGSKPPPGLKLPDYLRKDQVFLLERFYYHLEAKQDHGILVMDEIEKETDRRFVRQLRAYFSKSNRGGSVAVESSPLHSLSHLK